jgi:hypothetical protein
MMARTDAQVDRDAGVNRQSTPTVDASDAAEKARIAAMRKANAKSRPATLLEQTQNQIAKTQASISNLENTQAELDANPNAIPKAGTFLGYDYQGNTQTSGTLRRKIIADGKGGQKIDFQSTEKNPDYVSGSRGGGTPGDGTPGDGTPGAGTPGAGGTTGGNAAKLTASDGTVFTDKDTYLAYQTMLDEKETALDVKKRAGESAYDLLYLEFSRFGLGSLVEDVKNYIVQGLSKSELTLRLRTESKTYQKRFAANEQRVAKGLAALDEADYIGLEDQYQEIMRNYGLPASYYAKDTIGTQEGFQKFIANDVSATELEDRVMTAQNRVLNANPEVLQAIKNFYGDSITNGDILAYTLNPEKGLADIKRKVTAAEIGGAAVQSGLNLGNTPEQRALYAARAEELGAAGITKAVAQQGYGTIGGGLQRGSELAAIYGESPYTQTTAEKEVFGLAGKTEAEKQRKKITGLEKATFSGQTGISSGALARDRAGAY